MLMEYLGVVLEIKDNKAYLITDSCEVVCIRKQPGMYEGMEIAFESSEKVNRANSAAKYSAVIGSVAAVFIAIMFYVNLIYSNQIYAYVDIDINSNWELTVDKNNRVINIKTNDKNSKFLIEDINFKSEPLENVLVDMVEKLNKNGLIDLNSDNKVLITACLQDKEERQSEKNGLENLKLSYPKIIDELSSRNIKPYFIEARAEYRKLAADNNISVGRYSIYKKGKEQGIDIDIENLKQNEINDILEKVVIDRELDLNKGNEDIVNQDSKLNEDVDRTNTIDNNSNELYEEDLDLSKLYEEDIDLSIDGIEDIDKIKSIEAANIETQKVIQNIQKQVAADIAFETDKANTEISKIKTDTSISSEQKINKIKQIGLDLAKQIDEIKKIGNKKAQEELDKLEKKVKDVLTQIR